MFRPLARIASALILRPLTLPGADQFRMLCADDNCPRFGSRHVPNLPGTGEPTGTCTGTIQPLTPTPKLHVAGTCTGTSRPLTPTPNLQG
jgi:hypothetical protein